MCVDSKRACVCTCAVLVGVCYQVHKDLCVMVIYARVHFSVSMISLTVICECASTYLCMHLCNVYVCRKESASWRDR